MPGGPTMPNPKRHAITFRSACGGGEQRVRPHGSPCESGLARLLPAIDEDALPEASVADQTLGKSELVQALRQDQRAGHDEVLATRLQADKLAPLGARASDQIGPDPLHS